MAEAERVNAPGGVIAVADDSGNVKVLERIDGTFAPGADISIGKASAAMGGGERQQVGWLGAVLTGSKITAQPSAERQAHLVDAFLGSAVDACRALLSGKSVAPPRRCR
jgi:uncharacterized protein GlcG (DUF336 family)